MMSMVEEFPANDKWLALCSRLFPDAWERSTSCDWWDSTKPNACRLPDKAGSRVRAGAFRARRASSNHQFLAPRGFVFFFGQFAIGLEDHSKRIFQVLASLFQSLALGVNSRNFFHPGSPPIIHLLVRSGQFHLCIFLAFGLLVQSLAAREIVQKPLDEFVIYNLPVAFKSGNTTVLFPSAISGLYAKSVAAQEQPNADFLLSFTPGNFYFTVRALKNERRRPSHRDLQQKSLRPASRGFREALLLGDVLSRAATSRRRRGPLFPSGCFLFSTRRKRISFSRRITRTRWLGSSMPRPTPRTTTTISG